MFVNFRVLVLLANVGYIINKSFEKLDSDVSKQQVPCIYNKECAGRYNTCSLKIGDQTFCQCREGSSGDNCTVVDQCRDGLVDCGTNNNASCLLGGKGKAYCHCDDQYQGYVEETKTCRDCDCGDSLLVWGCQFGAEGKKCKCDIGAYQNHEGKCIDCSCGDGSIGCTFKEEVKTCKCFKGFVSNGSYCINCECGPNTECAMEGGNIVCTCNEGYLPSGSKGHICLMQCNTSNPCENGGTCSEGACLCRNGTGGDLCREVEDCRYGGFMCGEADCLYDIDAEEAYCKCRDPGKAFERIEKKCKVCDCGSHSKNCRFSYIFKKCTCEYLYDDLQGTCTSCSCGAYTRGCHFDRRGARICQCAQGYIQSEDECKECDCGQEGVCEFDDFIGKSCKCNKGYESNGQECLPCDCGDNGTCSLYDHDQARCSCHKGFEVYQGKCLACECGIGANCSFEGSETAAKKHCICPKGLSDDGGICKECDCQLDGSNCTFIEGLRACRCPPGFNETSNSSNQLTFCQDVDECLDSAACPKSATCVNTVGSYECVCGDEKSTRDVKLEGCPTGGLGTWAIVGIVAGCVIGVLVIIGGIDEYKKTNRQKTTELQASDIHQYQIRT